MKRLAQSRRRRLLRELDRRCTSGKSSTHSMAGGLLMSGRESLVAVFWPATIPELVWSPEYVAARPRGVTDRLETRT
jgi:hypothetical protein